MGERSYLIVHGLGGSGRGHWQAWLYERLKAAGEKVYFPSFPEPDTPKLTPWLSILKEEVKKLEGERFVICHSLGTILWLHYAQLSDCIQVEHLLLVAPPGPKAIETYSVLQDFGPIPMERGSLTKSAEQIRLVSSPKDEYCEENAAVCFGQHLSIVVDQLPDHAKHININSGYGSWPDVENWCKNPSFRIKK